MRRWMILFVFLVVNISYSGIHFIKPLPLRIGEKMVFGVTVLGMYMGDQTITVNKVKEWNGRTVVEGWGTSVSKRKIYYLNDKEKTYFDPANLNPLYNERWVHQGDWIDRMWFWYYPDQHKIKFKHHKGNNKINTINYKGRINSFYTMIAYMRSLDYDYYIRNNKSFSYGYLFGVHYKRSVFRASYTTVRYNGKETRAALVKEIGGMGYEFVVLLNQDRIPYRLVIPSDKLRMIITIKDFKRGQQPLPR